MRGVQASTDVAVAGSADLVHLERLAPDGDLPAFVTEQALASAMRSLSRRAGSG